MEPFIIVSCHVSLKNAGIWGYFGGGGAVKKAKIAEMFIIVIIFDQGDIGDGIYIF